MTRWIGIWYDLEGEKARDCVTAETEEEARKLCYLNHSEPPAQLLTIMKEE